MNKTPILSQQYSSMRNSLLDYNIPSKHTPQTTQGFWWYMSLCIFPLSQNPPEIINSNILNLKPYRVHHITNPNFMDYFSKHKYPTITHVCEVWSSPAGRAHFHGSNDWNSLVVEPPVWKLCSSNWIISPKSGWKQKLFETTTYSDIAPIPPMYK